MLKSIYCNASKLNQKAKRKILDKFIMEFVF